MAHFVYIADVFCPWCYGFAPVMSRLAKENPEFPVRVIGGNLISQPMTLAQDAAGNPGLKDFWHEVEHVTGRSLAGAINALETGAEVRLYSPGADEILVALKALAPGHQLEQLIDLEEMFYGQGRDMFTEGALTEIAKKWGVDVTRFERALDAPAALRATEENLAKAANLMGEITSYPSVLLAQGGTIAAVSRGYVQYETVAARLEDIKREMNIELTPGKTCSRPGSCTVGPH